MNPFDILKTIVDKRKTYSKEEVEGVLNISLIIKYLSNNNTGLAIADYLNNNYKMSVYDMYLFAQSILPDTITFIKYNKREKSVKLEDVKRVMEYYNCSYEVGEEYYEMMSQEAFNKISGIVSFMRKERNKPKQESLM